MFPYFTRPSSHIRELACGPAWVLLDGSEHITQVLPHKKTP
jgi:hypothetical protein